MYGTIFENPNVTVAIAMVAGILAQSAGIHLRVPGIVLLLGLGVLLGPDVLGVVNPQSLEQGLSSLVGFAVAVILFEGGMNLSLPHIRRAGTAIRRLITVGAAVTAVGAALAARHIMQWPWELAALFGSLLIVTGPTVVTPLVRRLRLERGVSTVLEAEGVLIDPIGAIAAFVVLEVVLHPSDGQLLVSAGDLGMRLGVGGLLGIGGGWIISRVLRAPGAIPEGLANVFTLSAVFALYTFSQVVTEESGIAAVTAAGIVVRYLGTPVERELLEFKEQLTVMLLGLLFVLLAADVRLDDVRDLGWSGVATVAALMFLVRPINVLVSTVGTDLTWKQRLFLSWIAPRGIVAAAVASLFAMELSQAGIPGGTELRALVFLVIAVTVVVSGLTGAPVAWLLGLRRPPKTGWVVLGAHPLARRFGQALTSGREEVIFVDVNPEHCRAAEREGFRVVHGNAMKESTLEALELDTVLGAVGLTRNEEVNFLFVQKAREEGQVEHLFVSLSSVSTGLTPHMVHKGRSRVLFGGPQVVERWDALLEAQAVRELWFTYDGTGRSVSAGDVSIPDKAVPMVFVRSGVHWPVCDNVVFRPGDDLVILADAAAEHQIMDLLGSHGFVSTQTRGLGGQRRQVEAS